MVCARAHASTRRIACQARAAPGSRGAQPTALRPTTRLAEVQAPAGCRQPQAGLPASVDNFFFRKIVLFTKFERIDCVQHGVAGTRSTVIKSLLLHIGL